MENPYELSDRIPEDAPIGMHIPSIPCRASMDTKPTILRDDLIVQRDHWMAGMPCLVCLEPMKPDERAVLIFLGFSPADRKPAGWGNGASWPLHLICATGEGWDESMREE